MKGKLTTKTIVVIALTVVLLAAAITGTVIFLKDSGRAEAMSEENLSERLPVAGADEEQNNNEQVVAPETNESGEVTETEENQNTEGTTLGTVSQTTTSGAQAPTTVNGQLNGEPAVSTVEQERVISEETNLSWNNISLNTVANMNASNMGINYKNLKYKVEYYFDGEIDTEITDVIEKNEKGKIINSYTDKVLLGYKLDEVEGLPLTVTENEENNVIKVYYIKDETQTRTVSYTVEYYHGTRKVDEEIVTEAVWVNDPVTFTVDENKYAGYKFHATIPSTIPEDIKDGEVIQVYYNKDESQTKTVSYTVEYYHGTRKVDEEIVTETVWKGLDELTVTTVVDKNKYPGYEFHATVPSAIPTTIKDGEVIKVYYNKNEGLTKKLSYTVEYYEGTRKIKEEKVEKEIWAGYDTDEIEVTTTLENSVLEGYTSYRTVPEKLPKTIKNGGVIQIYCRKRTDIPYTINYYKEYEDGTKINFKTETFKGEFEDSITVTDKKVNDNRPDGFTFEKRDPAQIQLGIDETKNILNIYYKADKQQYTVYYYKKDTQTEIAETKRDIAETEKEIEEQAIDLQSKGYTLVGEGKQKITISATEDNKIVFYYEPRMDISYTVNYYKEGTTETVAESKTVHNKTFGTEVKETAKTLEGYVPDEQTKTVTLDKVSGNEINFYYTIRTDISYTVNYYKEGTTEKLAESKTVAGKTFNTTVEEKAATVEGYTPDEQTKTLKLSKVSGNEINFYYEPRTDISYTVNYYKEGTTEKLAESKTVVGKTFNTTVEEKAATVEGYTPDKQTKTLKLSKVSGNEINFYYTKIEIVEPKTVQIQEISETINKKHIIIAMDRSYSMKGDKLEKEKQAVKEFVNSAFPDSNINNGATVTVIAYTDQWNTYTVGSAANYKQAQDLNEEVNKVYEYGVSDIKNTLEWILNDSRCLGNTAYPNKSDNVVIFIGDGNPEALFSKANKDNIEKKLAQIEQKSTIYVVATDAKGNGEKRLKFIARNGKYYDSSYDGLNNTLREATLKINESNITRNSDANGRVELNSKLYVDAAHPIVINGTTFTAKPETIILDEGKYYLDITKLEDNEQISIKYYVK